MKAFELVSAKEHGLASSTADKKSISAIQCKGYEARTTYLQAPIQRKENNTGLPDNLKNGIENLSGINMDDVNVHYNSHKPAGLNAHAYARGTDIHVGPGHEKHLGHEAWHVVQQKQGRVNATMQMKGANINHDAGLEHEADVMGSKAFTTAQTLPAQELSQTKGPVNNHMKDGVIQGDIGFEFETNIIETKKSNTGAILGAGFNSAHAANLVWNAPGTTRIKKGASLLKKADIDVQADDRGTSSDLEVVTTHFPLNAGGRTRLNNAMTDLNTLVAAHSVLGATSGNIVPAEALNSTAGFNTTMRDGLVNGDWSTATTAPQITFGTRIANVADIVRDLHGDPNESLLEKTARDPGRLRMRRENPVNINEPRNLSAGNESHTLVSGHTLAQNAIAAYRLLNTTAPAGPELEGLLTIIFTYSEGARYKSAFLKSHTPLMAKTNLATIFTTLPAPMQTYYSQKDNTGETNLEKIVKIAPNYIAKMSQPLFGGEYSDDMNKGPGKQQWYHKLTLSGWLKGIALRDRTRGEAVAQFFKDEFGGSTMRPGTDRLTNKGFGKKPRGKEIEGYGALGNRMDTDITHPATPLPVFELRSASKPITYAQAQQWALDLFDYVDSLNANPGGGHTRIV